MVGFSHRACVQKGVGEWCPRPFFCGYGSLGFLYDSWDIGVDLYYSLYMGLRWRRTVLYPFLFRLSQLRFTLSHGRTGGILPTKRNNPSANNDRITHPTMLLMIPAFRLCFRIVASISS